MTREFNREEWEGTTNDFRELKYNTYQTLIIGLNFMENGNPNEYSETPRGYQDVLDEMKRKYPVKKNDEK